MHSDMEANQQLQEKVRQLEKDLEMCLQENDKLRIRQKYLESVFKHVPDAIVTLDSNHNVIDWNTGANKIFGYSAKEAIGKNLDDLVSKGNFEYEARKNTEYVLAGNNLEPYETVRYDKNNNQVNVIASGSPIYENEDMIGIVSMYTDITDHIKTKKSLEKSEEKFEIIFEDSRDAIFIVDKNSKFVLVNQAACELTGYTKKELLNMKIPELHEKSDLEAYHKNFDQIIDGKSILTNADILRKDGTKVPTEFSNNNVVIGGEKYVHTVARDVTEREIANSIIKNKEAKLRSIFDASPNPILMIDKNGIVFDTNEVHAQRLNMNRNKLLNQCIWDFLPNNVLPHRKEDVEKVFETKLPVTNEDYRDGLWNEYKIYPCTWDEKWNITSVVIYANDITERKNAEQVIINKEKDYRAIINGMNDTALLIDKNGKFVDFNDSSVSLLGYSRDELFTMGPHDIDFHLKEDAVMMLIQKLSNSEKQVFETVHISKTGKNIPVEVSSSLVTYQGKEAILIVARDLSERKKTEQALRESESKFRTLFENAPVGIFLTDSSGNVVQVNPEMARIVGASSPEEVQEKYHDLSTQLYVYPESRQEFIRQLKINGEVNNFEFEAKKLDGEHIFISMNARIHEIEPDGTIIIDGFAKDITKRKIAEKELQRKTFHMENILKLSPALYYTFVPSVGGEHYSEHVEKTLGYSVDYLQKNPMIWYDSIHPDDQKKIDDLLHRLVYGQTFEIEYRIQNKYGEWLWFYDAATPYKDEEGHVTLYGAALDITRRKNTEKKLEKTLEEAWWAEKKLTALLSSSKAVNQSESFLEAARHIFYQSSQIIGHSSGYIALSTDDGSKNEVLFLEPGGKSCTVDPSFPMPVRGLREIAYIQKKVVFENDFWNCEWVKFLPKGHVQLDNVMFAPLMAKKKTIGVIGMANKRGGFNDSDLELAETFAELASIALQNAKNLDELRQSEKENKEARIAAEEASRSKSEFLANMSHEIRTPLNGIMGMLQVIQMTELDDEQTEYIEMATKASKRLSRLLSDILDLSRIEADKMEMREEEFLLSEIMQSIEDIFSHGNKENRNLLAINIDPRLPLSLIGDSTRLTQVLFNLVGNATKYTQNGHVDVQAYAMPSYRINQCRILFKIEDNGPGIPDDFLNKVFETFSQAHDSNTPYSRQYEGAGLGLPLAKRVVDLMGGNVSIVSKQNHGTCVYVCLNFKIQDSDTWRLDFAPKGKYPSSKSKKILIVDDDLTTLKYLESILKKHNFNVTIANNGDEALKELAKDNFDCILMDIQMPILDGVEATKKIKTSKAAFKDIPIIALTAYAMNGDKDKFLAAGMDDYIAKPVDKNELINIIKKHIS